MNIDGKALKLAGLYTLCGIGWIIFSDQILAALIPDVRLFSIISTWKGVLFILLSALVVYMASHRRKPSPARLQAQSSMRSFVLVFTLLAAGILLSGQFLIGQNHRERTAAELAKINAVGEFKIRQLTRLVERQQASLASLADDTLLQNITPDQADGHARLVARLEAWRNTHRLRTVMILDAQGQVLARAGQAVTLPAAISQQLRAPAAPLHSDIWQAGNGLALAFARPIKSADGTNLLLLSIDDPQRELYPLLTDWPLPTQTAEGLLFRRDGTLVRFISPLRFDTTPPLRKTLGIDNPQLLAAQALRGNTAPGQMLSGLDYRGKEVVGFVTAVPGSSWYLVAKIDRDELYAGAERDVARLTVLYGLILLLGGMLLYGLLQRRTLQQTRAVQQQMQEHLQALQLLDEVVESINEPILAKDNAGRYQLVNQATAAVFGRKPADVLGKTDRELFPPAIAAAICSDDEQIRQTGQRRIYEECLPLADGTLRTFHTIKGVLRDLHGDISGIYATSRDITDQKRAEEHLRHAQAVFDSMQDGVMITDLSARIIAVNRAFTSITGYSEDEARGRTPRLLQSGRQDESFYTEMREILQEQGAWQGEIWNRRKNGDIYPEWLRISLIRDQEGIGRQYVGVFTDMSQLRHNEAEVARLIHYDQLTALPNRQLITLQLEQSLRQAERHRQQLAILMIDLDQFKNVNDSLGHQAGDELLNQVANRLRRSIRACDFLGRLGGDEFLLILEIAETEDAGIIARELLQELARPVVLQSGHEASGHCSIGISIYPDDGGDGSTLLRGADTAMFQAKSKGRGQFCYYTSAMDAQAEAALRLETALLHALDRQEFRLHYQPKIDLASGQICGAEALIRWQQADGSLVSPAAFIPLAERSGQIIDIGNWVIAEACRQQRQWRDAGLPACRIAINVSARQLASGMLARQLDAALAASGIAASLLELELTESLMMEQPEETTRQLAMLKLAGFTLAIDDFGTGYSSLSYLVRFPVDVLKIDQSFVHDMTSRADAAALAGSIIALAHTLRLKVVAEGVETAEQLELLRSQGCDVVQGYYYHRPLPAAEFAALLQQEQPTIPKQG